MKEMQCLYLQYFFWNSYLISWTLLSNLWQDSISTQEAAIFTHLFVQDKKGRKSHVSLTPPPFVPGERNSSNLFTMTPCGSFGQWKPWIRFQMSHFGLVSKHVYIRLPIYFIPEPTTKTLYSLFWLHWESPTSSWESGTKRSIWRIKS